MKPLSEETASHSGETREIFVRAHTAVTEKPSRQRFSVARWTEEVLVFDAETTTDTAQRLTFGCYRLCKLDPTGYVCVEEGIFYAGDLDDTSRKILRAYVDDPLNSPATEIKMFPPQTRLKIY